MSPLMPFVPFYCNMVLPYNHILLLLEKDKWLYYLENNKNLKLLGECIRIVGKMMKRGEQLDAIWLFT